MDQGNFAEPTIEDRKAVQVACIRDQVSMDQIRQFYDSSFPAIFAALGELRISPSGAPLGIVYGQVNDNLDLAVAVPITEPFTGPGPVLGANLPAARTAVLTVMGDYSQLPGAYEHLHAWIAEQGLESAGWSWEQYMTEPVPGGDPAQNVTQLGVGLRD